MMARTFVSALYVALVVLSTAATPAFAQQPTHKPGGYHSPEIQKDQSWSNVFNATGATKYHCHPHPFMTGSVDVLEGASSEPVTITITGFKFVPDSVVVGVGTNVTWTNRDASFHTVDESLVPASADVKREGSASIGLVLALLGIVGVVGALRRR